MNTRPSTAATDVESRRIAVTIALLFSLMIILHYDLYRSYKTREFVLSPMLYLPAGKYLKPVSFGYHSLLADYIYLWSIQYYGDPTFHPRMEYLKHTYDLITDLDPHYLDAYQTGALFMFYEGRNPQAGLLLLEKGMEKNPREWILPTDAGFYCLMNLKNYKLAASYFERGSKIPGAPTLVKRMLAGSHFRMGETRIAYELWKEIYETAERASIRQAAFQHVHDLKVLIDLEALRNALVRFESAYNRRPVHLQQLVSAKLLAAIPTDPEDNPYTYDYKTGQITYGSHLKIYKKFQ